MTQMHFIVNSAFQVLFVICAIALVATWHYRKRRKRFPATPEAPQEYGVPCTTLRGEKVRSFPECFIANFLHLRQINYRYEEPLTVRVGQIQKRLLPDFYLPDFNVYVEYWGLIGVSSDYEQDMRWKMAQYHRNEIRFISIYPENLPYPFNGSDFDGLFRYKFQKVTGIALSPAAAGSLVSASKIRPANSARREEIIQPKN